MMLVGGQTTDFYMNIYFTFSAHCTVQHWLRLPNCLQATLTDESCETNHLLEEQKLLGGRLGDLFPASLQVSTCGMSCALCVCWSCVVVRRAVVIIGDAKQAMRSG